jgi:hypothetical protein
VDWSVTGRLAGGSIPATILTLFALYILGIKGNDSSPLITTALGIALVMTAVCVLSHRWLRLLTATRHAWPDPRWTATLTTFAALLLMKPDAIINRNTSKRLKNSCQAYRSFVRASLVLPQARCDNVAPPRRGR